MTTETTERKNIFHNPRSIEPKNGKQPQRQNKTQKTRGKAYDGLSPNPEHKRYLHKNN